MHHSFFELTIVMYVFTCLYTGHHVRQIVLPDKSTRNTTTNKLMFFAVYFLLSSSIFLGFTEKFGDAIQNFGCILWGFYFYFLVFCFLSDLFLGALLLFSTIKHKQLVTEKVTRITYIGSIVLCIVFLIFGAAYAKVIRVASYDITIKQPSNASQKNISASPKDLRIVMLSDTHLGKQLGLSDVKRWVDKINALQPDIVCICGDIFNDSIYDVNYLEQIQVAFSSISSTYGTFSCLGNHDTYGIIDDYGNITQDARSFFEGANITLLHDDYRLIDNSFYIVGRRDASPSMDETNYTCKDLSEILKDTNKDYPIILLDHRPQRFDEAIDNNVSLLLAGHTHLGQLFPANIITNVTYECDYGLYTKEDNGHSFNAIVSSGLGYWGPPLRIGSSCEVVVVNITIK